MRKISRVLVSSWCLRTCLAIFTMLLSNKSISTTVQASFKISEHIFNGCQISQKKEIDFGNLSIAELVDKRPVAVGEIDVCCTPGVVIGVTLDGGKAASNNQRNMQTPDHKLLSYDIFFDPAYTLLWPPNLNHEYSEATSEPIAIPLYARLDTHNSIPKTGNYQDVINVTVKY